jgi:hypothetical protein
MNLYPFAETDDQYTQATRDWPAEEEPPEEEDDDDDDDEFSLDEEPLRFYPLCSPATDDPSSSFPSLSLALDYDQKHHALDFLNFVPTHSDLLFFEKCIALINQCRAHVHSCKDAFGADNPIAVGESLTSFLQSWTRSPQFVEFDITAEDNEPLFRPFLCHDAWLQCLEDLYELKRCSEHDSHNLSTDTNDLPNDEHSFTIQP